MKVTHHTTELAQILEQQKKTKVGFHQVADVASDEAEEGVTLEISDEAKQKYMEQEQLKFMYEQNMQAMKQQEEAAAKQGDDMAKAMTIFRRIANGDIVPWSDEKKLMEYSSELYQAAKNIGAMSKNDDPKKYKSVDEDDEKNQNGAVDAETAVEAIVSNVEEGEPMDSEF